MGKFPVTPEKEQALNSWMEKLGVREQDLDESFIRGSGPGGQHRNKSSTAVMLSHRPSGVSARVERSRSQALNRYLARRLLCMKIERIQAGKRAEELEVRNRIRRQKLRRLRRNKKREREQNDLQSAKRNQRTLGKQFKRGFSKDEEH